ncbi:MAG: ABC transporter permease, partial [Oscillospiraceae bacterium]
MKTKYVSTPYLLWMLMFIFAPLCLVIYFAFTNSAGNFTLSNLSELTQYSTVFLRSILLAALATILCLVMAYPVSYFLSRLKASKQKMMLMIIILPMWMNFLLRTYAWMSLLEKNGLINRFFGIFGIGPFNMINTNGAV